MAKEKWEPMEIARVKLNPEQAVLTCCQQPGKGLVYDSEGWQCAAECGAEYGFDADSMSS